MRGDGASPGDLFDDLRGTHSWAALGTVVLATVCLAAGISTHEIGGESLSYYVLSCLVALTAWVLVRDRQEPRFLFVWPVLVLSGLLGASFVAPVAATLCLGTMVLAFIFTGLALPAGWSLILLPYAVVTMIFVADLPLNQAFVRFPMAASIWMCCAELPAWLARRLRAARDEVDRLATTDPLTGLGNRRAWELQLQTSMAQAARTEAPLVVAIADLDHFKEHNDVHGHLAGDQLLQDFAEEARSRLRPGDVIARWGGEEFAIALPDCTVEDARAILERVRASLPDGQTCSIGMAQLSPGETADEVMRRADEALYEAKRLGRDRIVAGRQVVVPEPFPGH